MGRLLALLLLALAPPVGAVERLWLELHPWWLVADAALARGDCRRAIAELWPPALDGEPGAIARLGEIAETNACPGQGLPAPAALYEGLTALGLPAAKLRLARLHLAGEGVPRDEALARELFTDATVALLERLRATPARESIEAALRPHPVPPVLAEEVLWLERAEAAGAEGLLALALRLRAGDGVPQSEAAARNLLARATHKRLPAALYELGVWELEQASAPSELREALDRILLAAELGSPPAIRHIALQLFEGRNVRDWDFRTYIWLLHARAVGEDVEAELDTVAARLSENERIVARDWLRRSHLPPVHFILE